jgi:hypothetical protein
MSNAVPHSETVLLTIRGKHRAPSVEAARELHNGTAGLPESIAASRALGDLSHKVYVPAKEGDDELLILDVWRDPAGIQAFFSDHNVQAGGARLFSERDPVVWMPAAGSLSFHLPAPIGKGERFVGILRARVKSPQEAIAAFRESVVKGLSDARRLGQIGHEIFIRLGSPSDPAELLGVDLWFDAAGMMEYYQKHMGGLAGAFAGAPATSVWKQPVGHWIEW